MGFFSRKKHTVPKKASTKARGRAHLHAVVVPAPQGWYLYWQSQVHGGAWESEALANLDELPAKLPGREEVQLLLPMRSALTHQITVPTDEPEEAASMAELQAEKVLPFPHQDCPLEISLLDRGEDTFLVGLCAASPLMLERLLQPLLDAERWPEYLGLHIEALARQCPADQIALLLDIEDGDIVMGVARYGALVSAEVLSGVEDEPLGIDDIDRVLWELRMMRVPAEFTTVRVGAGLAGWCGTLREHLGMPAEVVELHLSWPVPTGDLMPHSWRRQWQNAQNARLRQRWFGLAGAAYLALILLAGGFLYWQSWQLGSLRAEAETKIEEASEIAAMRAEWETWAPAVDPSHFAVELLHQILQGIQSDDLKLTRVMLDKGVLRLDGEAASLTQANRATEQIEGRLEASGFEVSHPPPSVLPNNRVRFNITAKR